jgi:hypothetical protein
MKGSTPHPVAAIKTAKPKPNRMFMIHLLLVEGRRIEGAWYLSVSQ